jgi:hypothetical protein
MSGPAAQFAGPAAPGPPGNGREGLPLGKAVSAAAGRWRVTISAGPASVACGWLGYIGYPG